LGEVYHLVAVGLRRGVTISASTPVQEAIDALRAEGALVFLAHPYWSGMTVNEMFPLERLHGQEIYNTSAHGDLGKGLSTVQWDDLLVRGKCWWGIADDDTHGVNDDADGGWVWVKSECLDETSILRALKQGVFYSSSGPVIHDLRLEQGIAYVRCSPVAAINFIGHTQWGFQRRAAPGESITEAEWRLTGNERYLRAECWDADGHGAWTNPLFLG